MLRDIGRCVHHIAPWDVSAADSPVTSDTPVEVLCTYNWSLMGTRNLNPVILVPGMPCKWAPLSLPAQLAVDQGGSLVDAHAYWRSTFQYEPTFQAISSMNPTANFETVDVMVNRNSLTKLLDFVAGKRTDQFHMDLHMISNTLIIGRNEKNAQINSNGSSFGHSFEKAFTSAQHPSADTYHRVIRYKLASLDIVVRHEVDTIYESADKTTEIYERYHGVDKPDNLEATISCPILHPSATAVIERGTRVPQHKVAEITTSAKASPIRQCWFGRTQNLCVARHRKGLFTEAEMKNIWSHCQKWEQIHQHKLQLLAGLLGQLREVMKGVRRGRGVLVRMEREAPLQIYEGNEGMQDALPQEVASVFWR